MSYVDGPMGMAIKYEDLCIACEYILSHVVDRLKNQVDRMTWSADVSFCPGLPQCMSNRLLNGTILG